MIIGFGSTEKQVEEAEATEFRIYCSDLYKEMNCIYVTDEFVKKVTEWIQDRAEKSRERADKFKTDPNHPERYSSYYIRVVHGASDVVAIASFMHINRRHPMSPDGWAVMCTTALFHFYNRG